MYMTFKAFIYLKCGKLSEVRISARSNEEAESILIRKTRSNGNIAGTFLKYAF
jgi:hypothetical protein